MLCLGSTLEHFFVYDLVNFSKANLEHGRLLKEMLENYYEVSSDKINAMKTIIFFSKGVEDYTTNLISTSLGFQIVQNLRHYLGVPLFHHCVMNNTMHFMVEKVRRKI